jgi:hypothetical protein
VKNLAKAFERMIFKGLTTSGQFDICPGYNELISTRRNFITYHLPNDAVRGFGPPEDYELFLKEVAGNAAAATRA